jgi:hypothetical protein
MNRCIRQSHRWMSMAFTLAFLVNFFAWRGGTPPAMWVTSLALVPLGLLLLSGLYLFAQPYFRGRHAHAENQGRAAVRR